MMPLRASLASFAFLLMTLAGCAGGASEPAPAAAQQDFAGVEFDDSTGAIEGTVIDTGLQPLENATVQLLRADKGGTLVGETLSTLGGAFGFSRVEPGAYRVRATLDGFGSASRLVTVEAGATESVRLPLEDSASTDPYVMTFIKSGYLSCAAATIVFPTNNQCPGDEAIGNATIRFDIPEGFLFFISETQWEKPGEHLSQYFYARYLNESSDKNETRSILDLWGGSVLRSSFSPGELKATVNPGTGALIVNAPVPTKAFNLTVISYYAGQFSEEINQTVNPVCRPVYSRCAGIGVTLGLKYQQFLSIFIFGVPDDVEHYSAVPDT
jgi:hypothetical protein